MAKTIAIKTYKKRSRKKRPGVHSKKRNSVNKFGKNYNKKYRGQGR